MNEFEKKLYLHGKSVKEHIVSPVSIERKDFFEMKSTKKVSARFILVTAVIVVLGATTVLAATNSSFQELLSQLNPIDRHYVQPIELSCIDNGIKMEVVAVGAYGNRLKAYITMQDIEGKRLNETSEFYINAKADGGVLGGGAENAYYDKDSGLWTVLYKTVPSSALAKSGKVTFSMEEIQSNPQIYNGQEYDINLTQVNKNPKIVQVSRNGDIGVSATVSQNGNVAMSLLKPNEIIKTFPKIDYCKITNMGIIDGKLHLQVWRDSTVKPFSNIYLIDKKGQLIQEIDRAFFAVDKNNKIDRILSIADENGKIVKNEGIPEHYEYTEYIYDIDINNIEDYTLTGEFTKFDEIDGNWQVTAEFDSKKDIIEINKQMDIDGLGIDKIVITPFGIDFSGSKYTYDAENFDVRVYRNNESVQLKWGGGVGFSNDGKYEAILFDSPKPIDTSSINSISINGRTIPITKR
ncbi:MULTISPECIES: hypothetical protein [Sporanaerobacter]|uniref:DUF4179 domain-containing protein n=1 Tax=Sporanaerobacter acetigenes DSM 13106 TaxID=1123281 RepID=A0A1M5YVU7_9FIRM|nr:hypothetical protein [Sporanaerobacter acetigenes]SHI15948.1 hypothetical protein SAMN02745180_02477 [Sporanaerobacter acetigenes DSM 13106]